MSMEQTFAVEDFMTHNVVTVGVNDSVYDATRKMVESNVGCIVAMSNGEVMGIITKGDILRNSLLKLLDPKTTKVESVMTYPFVTIDSGASLEDAAELMSKRHVSKLPVLQDGLLVGIITATDIIRVEPEYVKYLRALSENRPQFKK